MIFQPSCVTLKRTVCRALSVALLFVLAVCGYAQSAPSGIWATANATSNLINWNVVTGASSYNIYRGTSPGGEGSTPVATGLGTSYTDLNVTAGKTYYYKAAALFGSKVSTLSAEVSCMTGSSLAGTTVPVTFAGSNQVSIFYSPVPSATFYRIFRYANFSGFQLIGTTSNLDFVDKTASDGIEWYYVVVPGNAATDGNISNQVSAVPGDGALGTTPVAMTVASSGVNNVVWQPVPGASGYVVYRGFKSGGEGSQPYALSQGSSFTDNAVTNGQTYYYTIAAIDYSGTGKVGPESSGTPGSTPLTGGLVVAAASPKSITLTWQPVSGATSYYIVRGDGNFYNNQTLLAYVTSGVNYTDTAIVASGTYQYAVYPASVNGTTVDQNNIVTAKVGDSSLVPPNGLTAISQQTDVQLNWDADPGAIGYAIYRSTSGTPLLYDIAYYTTGYTDNGAHAGVTYTYAVSALSAASESGLSSTVTCELNQAQLPSPLATATVSHNNITIYWNLIPGATSYDVFRAPYGNSFVALATGFQPGPGATLGAYTDTTAPPDTDCAYYVCAVGPTGLGNQSNQVSAGTGEPIPAVPTGSYAYGTTQNGGGYAINVAVNPAPGVNNFNVYRSTKSGKEGSLPYAVNVGNNFTDTSVTAGVVYYYTFTTVDNDGQSAFSPECSAAAGSTPLAAPILTAYVQATKIDIDWSAVPNAVSYDVFRAIGNGQYTLYQQNVTSTTLVDTDVPASQSFSYRVLAVDAKGAGLLSNTVTARIGSTAPGITTGIFAYPIGTGSVINWNYVPGAVSYNVFRSTTSGDEGLVPIGNATGGQGIVSYTDTTGSSGKIYYYTVTAVTQDNQGAPSEEVTVEPKSSQLVGPSLSATFASGKVTLSWTAVPGAKSYDLFRTDPIEGYILYQQNVTGLKFTDTSVINGVGYSYFVLAVELSGAGNGSGTVSGTP